MGGNSSKLEKALAECPENIYGLENFGNTCYCNSVLQALYFCRPFREKVLQYAQNLPSEENLLTCLAEMFYQINSSKKRTGVYPPKKFVQRLKRDNELFRSYMHQDAHEFLNYLLNQACEILEEEEKQRRGGAPGPGQPPITTWVHEIFQGKLVNETRCLHCETVTNREEVFMDLSLEIDQNCSLTSCLRNFSAMEMLDKDDKFFCDHCCCLQEAQKRMLIKQAPACLILHLKRFKYIETQGRMRKLMYRVVFPLELKLSNTTADAMGADVVYSLFSVVVHVGSGPHHGHYVSLIKSHGNWLYFDDDNVESITESQVQSTFGSTQEYSNSNMDHGYLLFFERVTPGSSGVAAPA
mmetsp:Transcript_1105/g.2404  ORF Transcript_1105/g.2404 Transcript_1105/m.2404 type:complete len:354 (-) Transcript_1105:746-1807(-)|eukprot:CAMPEP_0202899054 /NCGR_PEP_ID=MMETSP1392-20130828/7396_1 /ASSEMBLY_ACC=CAM_ASM_000868 /TAXON_ID=225041 /ORGANISM="Chlamydomonas chlamydogama, Strain SAG 11-48b" /LENGTH=353 /DNA_ID=CAMNT_0049585141 /DNA_START=228 /DNA_END=1289 /DNA_ORIENTATION=-